MPPTLNTYPIKVYFSMLKLHNSENPISFGGIGPDNPLSIPQGVSTITFSLEVIDGEPDGLVAFPTFPIEWFDAEDPETPVAQPEWFTIQRLNSAYFVVVDFNSAPVRMNHPFNVLVSYQNRTYGSDPTIVNEPPIQ